jgi:hypothetical protein
MQQAKMAESQAEAQARINEYNAKSKRVEAQNILESAKLEETRVARMARLFRGEWIAKKGISGTELTGYSSIEVLGDIAYQTRMDRDITLRSGVIGAGQSRAEARGSDFQARWSRLYGKQVASSYMMSGIAGAVGGLSKTFGMMPFGR